MWTEPRPCARSFWWMARVFARCSRRAGVMLSGRGVCRSSPPFPS